MKNLKLNTNSTRVQMMWSQGTHLNKTLTLANSSKALYSVKRRITLKNHQWHNIDWNKVETKVKGLQEKIVVATLKNDLKEVYRLQWLLIQSFEAQALAIRKIVTNKGGSTAGIDGIIWTTPRECWSTIGNLASLVNNKDYKGQPVRRVYIPKPNST